MADTQEVSKDILLEKYCKGTETTKEEIYARVAKGVASVEKTKALRDKWEKKFYQNMVNGAIGAGRIMGAAGTDLKVSLINCFHGDTIVLTENGPFPIKELKDKICNVKTAVGVHPAEFRSFGVQKIYQVTFSNGQKIKTTLGHQWVVRK